MRMVNSKSTNDLDEYGFPLIVGKFVGLSTDEKPVERLAEGSTFLEEDTSQVAMLRADKTWHYL